MKQARPVGLGDVDLQLLVHGDQEVERVHRVDVELVAQAQIGPDRREIGLGCDVGERAQHATA